MDGADRGRRRASRSPRRRRGGWTGGTSRCQGARHQRVFPRSRWIAFGVHVVPVTQRPPAVPEPPLDNTLREDVLTESARTPIEAWPELNWPDWQETADTLHLWTQIVGKVRMKLAPMVNHWWQVTLYLTSRGLTTSPIPYGAMTFDVQFDFIDHVVVIETSVGGRERIALSPISVAAFYSEFME